LLALLRFIVSIISISCSFLLILLLCCDIAGNVDSLRSFRDTLLDFVFPSGALVISKEGKPLSFGVVDLP
jgi:hypothetical protein